MVETNEKGSSPADVDVLILTALKEEYDAVLEVDTGAAPDTIWQVQPGPTGLDLAFRTFLGTSGHPLRIAVTRAIDMGGMAAANAAAPLVTALRPSCLAMCGVCAGRRGEVNMGDVIIADRLWTYDTGSTVVEIDEQGHEVRRFKADPLTYNLGAIWKHRAESFQPDLTEAWVKMRPRSYDDQADWLLTRILAGEDPRTHPERRARCADFDRLVPRLRSFGRLEPSGLALSEAGRAYIDDRLLLHPDGLPEPEAFAVRLGPIGTGTAVVRDPHVFDKLSERMRKVIGLEMEAAAIGAIAHLHGVEHMIVMKGVMDHADPDKADNFKPFAARASGECLIAFLRRNLEPKPALRADGPPEPRVPDRGEAPRDHGLQERSSRLLTTVRRMSDTLGRLRLALLLATVVVIGRLAIQSLAGFHVEHHAPPAWSALLWGPCLAAAAFAAARAAGAIRRQARADAAVDAGASAWLVLAALALLPAPFSPASVADPCYRLRVGASPDDTFWSRCRQNNDRIRHPHANLGRLAVAAGALAAQALDRWAEPETTLTIIGPADAKDAVLWVSSDGPLAAAPSVELPSGAALLHLDLRFRNPPSLSAPEPSRTLLAALAALFDAEIVVMSDGREQATLVFSPEPPLAIATFLPGHGVAPGPPVSARSLKAAAIYARTVGDGRRGPWPNAASLDLLAAVELEKPAGKEPAVAPACDRLLAQLVGMGAVFERLRDKAMLKTCWPELRADMRAAAYMSWPEGFDGAPELGADATPLTEFASALHEATTRSPLLRRIHPFEFKQEHIARLTGAFGKLLADPIPQRTLLACPRLVQARSEIDGSGVAELAASCVRRADEHGSTLLLGKQLVAVDGLLLGEKVKLTPADVVTLGVPYANSLRAVTNPSSPLFRAWLMGLPLYMYVTMEAPDRVPSLPDLVAVFRGVIEQLTSNAPRSLLGIVGLVSMLESAPGTIQQIFNRLLQITGKDYDYLWWMASMLSAHPAPLLSAAGTTMQTVLVVSRHNPEHAASITRNPCRGLQKLGGFLGGSSLSGLERGAAQIMVAANTWLAEYLKRAGKNVEPCQTEAASARADLVRILPGDAAEWTRLVDFAWNISLDWAVSGEARTYQPYHAQFVLFCDTPRQPLRASDIERGGPWLSIRRAALRGACAVGYKGANDAAKLGDQTALLRKELEALASWVDPPEGDDRLTLTRATETVASLALQTLAEVAQELGDKGNLGLELVARSSLRQLTARFQSATHPILRWIACNSGVLQRFVRTKADGKLAAPGLTKDASGPCQAALRSVLPSLGADEQVVAHVLLALGALAVDDLGEPVADLQRAVEMADKSELWRALSPFGSLFASRIASLHRDWATSVRLLSSAERQLAEFPTLMPRYRLSVCLAQLARDGKTSRDEARARLRSCLDRLRQGSSLRDLYGMTSLGASASMFEAWDRGAGVTGEQNGASSSLSIELGYDPLGGLLGIQDYGTFRVGVGWTTLGWRRHESLTTVIAPSGARRTSEGHELQVALIKAILGLGGGAPDTEHLVVEADRLVHIARDENLFARSYFLLSVEPDDVKLVARAVQAELSRCRALSALTLLTFVAAAERRVGGPRPPERIGRADGLFAILRFVQEQLGEDLIPHADAGEGACARVLDDVLKTLEVRASGPAEERQVAALLALAETIGRASAPGSTERERTRERDVLRAIRSHGDHGRSLESSVRAALVIGRLRDASGVAAASAQLSEMDVSRHQEAAIARSLFDNRLLFLGLDPDTR
jgi:nucleoside phosphorylase